jgi:putative flavoprotein involved in K+ transport
MRTTTVTIIGAGQAGLAMSRVLTSRSIDHVLLERGEVANSWRTERWDSLRLLSPNWMTRLPEWRYSGPDQDGYMAAAEVAHFLDAYRTSFDAPVYGNTTVRSVSAVDDGYEVATNDGVWKSQAVVIATGAASTPKIPSVASSVPASIHQLAPIQYKNPDRLDGGDVLVVGASASGVQLADELARSGRNVTLAVSDHVRIPRTYRGMDIHWWMDTIGVLDERYDEVEDITRARRLPSLQLIGSPEQRNVGLNELSEVGVRLAGRLVGVTDSKVQFSGSLANACASADLKQGRLLDAIDDFSGTHGMDPELSAPTRPEGTQLPESILEMDLSTISTMIWATGFRPSYPWLPDEVLDPKGAIIHDGGVMNVPGMYVLGLPFQRRRKSTFLDGVGSDAEELGAHLATHLDSVVTSSARSFHNV